MGTYDDVITQIALKASEIMNVQYENDIWSTHFMYSTPDECAEYAMFQVLYDDVEAFNTLLFRCGYYSDAINWLLDKMGDLMYDDVVNNPNFHIKTAPYSY